MSNDPRLSNAQEEIRLRGLRLLARMIARAHLKDQVAANGPNRDAAPPDVERAPSAEADRHAR